MKLFRLRLFLCLQKSVCARHHNRTDMVLWICAQFKCFRLVMPDSRCAASGMTVLWQARRFTSCAAPRCRQGAFLFWLQLLDRIFQLAGIRTVLAGLRREDSKRGIAARKFCAFTRLVLGKTPLQIVGDAGVKAVLGAFQDIDAPRAAGCSLDHFVFCLPRFGWQPNG